MKVYTLDSSNEEKVAVISAKTSRSPHTFDIIAQEVEEKGYKPFLTTNVLGYGHDSVAEFVQSPVVAIEDVPDLVANIIATSDPQLKVQMTSTRYQSMATRGITAKTKEGVIHASAMRDQYMAISAEIERMLEPKDYKRKRTLQCDIARAWLPAGIHTQLSIRADARTLRDAVTHLIGHQEEAVKEAGHYIHGVVKGNIETLFDRHVNPEPSNYALDPFAVLTAEQEPGSLDFDAFDTDALRSRSVLKEVALWKESGWHRRFRMASAAGRDVYLHGRILSDYGAYRDLRRNRTLIQEDLLPNPTALPQDPYWAFRESYPDFCEELDAKGWELPKALKGEADPFLAPMGSLMLWGASGHLYNWLYAMRLRSSPTSHLAYALPMRYGMREILDSVPALASIAGIVHSPKSLLEVEFEDRV